MKTITFDHEAVIRLRRLYEYALERGDEELMFDGAPLLVSYAKYLLEYLEARIK